MDRDPLEPDSEAGAWLYETLRPHVDEVVMTGVTESRGRKSDKRDTYGLAERRQERVLDPVPGRAALDNAAVVVLLAEGDAGRAGSGPGTGAGPGARRGSP